MKKYFVSLQCLVLVLLAVAVGPAQAQNTTGFNMNFVVADDLFVDYLGMSATTIQEFLNSQPGILKTYVADDGRTAAQVIFDAAQASQISPKVILTNIEKESGMISRTSFPSGQQYYLDWIMFYGWCDSCTTGTNRGFVNQITAATSALRRYLEAIAANGYTISYWGPNLPKDLQCIDSDFNNGRELCAPGTTVTITPATAATAALYTYTPHPGGNFAFWYIWNIRFNFNLTRIYPDGSILRAKNSADIWLIQNGQKRRFTNSTAFLSRYSFSRVITVSADHLLTYETGREITYANYTLLMSPDGGVYLLANDLKRPVKTRAAFNQAGYRMSEVVKVGWDVLNQFPNGEAITVDNIFPSGRLLQNKVTGGIFYVKDGIRHAIMSKPIFRSQFGAQKSFPVSPDQLDKFSDGPPVGFKDGELVTSVTGGTAYFISNGYRLPIASWEAAKAYKFYPYLWGNLLVVDERSLTIHPIGPTLDVDTTKIASVTQ